MSTAAEPHARTALLDRLLAIDAELHGVDQAQAARSRAREYRELLADCNATMPRPGSLRCTLDMLFDDGRLQPTAHDSAPEENTVSTVLVDGRGSCSALIAATLALTEASRDPFRAVVLRNHVLLASTSTPDQLFEVLDRGRPVDGPDLTGYELPPTPPQQVDGLDFLPYYIDNLAARLADADRPSEAEALSRKALDLAPDNPRVRYNWGTVLLGLDRPAEAVEQLTLAIRLGWKDADAFANRGAAHWKLGQERRARRDFKRALKLDPRHRQAATNLRKLEAEAP